MRKRRHLTEDEISALVSIPAPAKVTKKREGQIRHINACSECCGLYNEYVKFALRGPMQHACDLRRQPPWFDVPHRKTNSGTDPLLIDVHPFFLYHPRTFSPSQISPFVL